MLDVLRAIPGVTVSEPAAAFYAFAKVDGVTDSARFVVDLLNASGVALAPGIAFGPSGEGHVRLVFAASEPLLIDALQRLAIAVPTLLETRA